MNPVKSVKIRTTETFDKTLDNTIVFLTHWSDEEDVITKVDAVLANFQSQVEQHPNSYSRDPDLMSLGVNSVRRSIDRDFKILYEVTENEEEIIVDLLLFLRTKQSVQQQLIEYCLYQ